LPSEMDDQQKARKRTDFDKILVESVNESIAIVLGGKTSPELERHLQAFLSFSYGKIDNLELLFSSLERTYGLFGSAVPELVVKKMYEKANVPFYEVAGTPLIQYVYDLKLKLGIQNGEREIMDLIDPANASKLESTKNATVT